ncbi:MAG TPA: enoyl-CoA hydratase-related protein [Terriglobales bacterium]|nr:enoyl-CoA hydratase-related protein [Terriglobales bacterium]
MSYQHLRLERSADRHIVTLTFNRPESRNAMTPAMGDEVVRAVEELRHDGDVRVVVLTGSGKSFSSGGDLSMLARDTGVATEGEAPSMEGSPREFYSRYLSLRSLPVPTIAAINGHAIGAGLCIALACDIRIAAEDAKMGMTFTRLGIHPGMGGTYLLTRLVGTARACELFFTGRIFDASEGERLGLLNRVVPRPQFQAAVDEMVQQIASAAPVAVRMVKRSIYRGSEHSLEDMIEFEGLSQAHTFSTADAREGVSAIIEKREPRFTGK